MGLFKAIFRKKDKTINTQPSKTLFNYDFELDNYIPNIKTKTFSQDLSLAIFIKSFGFSTLELNSILSSSNPINDFEKTYKKKKQNYSFKTKEIDFNYLSARLKLDIILRQYDEIPKLLSLMFIDSIYFLSGVSSLSHNEKNEYFLNIYNNLVNNPNDTKQYPFVFDKQNISCIAIYQLNSGITTDELTKKILRHIEDTYTKYESTQMIFKYLSSDLFQKIIMHKMTEMYTDKKLSISWLLLDKNKIDTSNFSDHIFDIRKMKHTKDGKYYLIPKEYQNKCTNDIISLNKFIDEASKILNKNLTLISENKISFKGSTYGHGCLMSFTPLTKTGKASKYPYCLTFDTYKNDDLDVIGYIYYLKDGAIGKVELTTWNKHIGHTINLATKNGKLVINRIYGLSDSGRTTLFKYEDLTYKIE